MADDISEEEPVRTAVRSYAEALEQGDGAHWFETLYAQAETGRAVVPWDRGHPQPLLTRWLERRGTRGDGRTAIVVGCGPGYEAELVAAGGWATTAFDVSPTAVAGARRRTPGSPVDYRVADVLDLPPEWTGRFDLVVESPTVQSLPPGLHAASTAAISGLVAPGGTLLVIAVVAPEPAPTGPPWPLTRSEVDAFATATSGGLEPVLVEQVEDGPLTLWSAEFRRSG